MKIRKWQGESIIEIRFNIIIVVYNVEQYLERCISTVLPALEKSDEIILSLGSSTDKSTEISQRYAVENSNIKLIFQNGKGLSNARNCALQKATGDFILFIDSDDFIDTGALKNLLGKIRSKEYEADIIITDFYRYSEFFHKSIWVKQIGNRNLSGLEAFPLVAIKRQSFWNVWRCVYRRTFLEKNQIYFKENTYAEDIDFTIKAFLAGPQIKFTGPPYYYYRVGREGSLMSLTGYDRVNQTVTILKETIDRLRNSKEVWSQVAMERLQYEYILNFALLKELPIQQQKKAAQLFTDYQYILTPTKDPVVIAVRSFTKLMGIETTAQLLAFTKKIKRKYEHRSL